MHNTERYWHNNKKKERDHNSSEHSPNCPVGERIQIPSLWITGKKGFIAKTAPIAHPCLQVAAAAFPTGLIR
jgi:hypothetical protein